MSKKVAIVGAGLSGLACAMKLKEQGQDVHVFESTDRVGGRVKTDNVGGFLLDHGFQVFLPSYELGPHFLDYAKLNLQSFDPGAAIFVNGAFHRISDPLRQPSQLLNTLFSPLATIKDKLLTLKLIGSRPMKYTDVTSGGSALQFLKNFGFSDRYIETFFVPFFSGVFLTKDLSVSESYFLYLFQRFAQGYASLPWEGMEQLPLQMAEAVGWDRIQLQKPTSVEELQSQDFAAVVSAHAPCSQQDPDYYGVTTHYYKTQSTKWVGKTLYLNGESSGVVNHVACLTAVNPNYAPAGWHLYSVNVLEGARGDLAEHLAHLFGTEEVQQWEPLKSYHIRRALPAQPQYGVNPSETSGVWTCGDQTQSPSIQGALFSGKTTAEAILKV